MRKPIGRRARSGRVCTALGALGSPLSDTGETVLVALLLRRVRVAGDMCAGGDVSEPGTDDCGRESTAAGAGIMPEAATRSTKKARYLLQYILNTTMSPNTAKHCTDMKFVE